MPPEGTAPHYWSLARRQQTILLSSLTGVALLLGVGGAWYIEDFAERTSDRVLRASVNAVSETFTLEGSHVTLEVPSDAFGMLEDNARDNVYYAVRSGRQIITGYGDFPAPEATPAPDETLYRYDTYLGQRGRVATQARYLTDTHPPVIVEVAETLDERKALVRRMLIGLVGLEIALVGIAAALIRPAVRWGLLPLIKLRAAMETRGDGSRAFEPLDPAQAPTELSDLILTFNLLLHRLDGTTHRVREFTADASHQMRTPLAALRAHLHLARQPRVAPDEREEALTQVEAAAVRLERLLNQLLALTRSQNLIAAPTAPADLVEIVADVARDLVPRALQAGMDIHLDGPDRLFVAMQPVIVQEMVANIIDNAIRYARGGSTILLRIVAREDRALVEIEDDGPGIPPGERAIVFTRFHRLVRDHDVAGSGLGLAIVQSLAKAGGAQVTLLDGTHGQGLLVLLSFPLCREAEDMMKG